MSTKEGREMDLMDDISFLLSYFASTIEWKGCVRVLCIAPCYVTLVLEYFKSKIRRSWTVGISAESSVTKKQSQY